MTIPAPEPAQQTAARVAGFLYVLTNLTAIFAYSTRGQLTVRGDAAQTAANIAGSERLFRIGTVTELITVAGVLMLVVALCVVVRPVNQDVALLAAAWHGANPERKSSLCSCGEPDQKEQDRWNDDDHKPHKEREDGDAYGANARFRD